MKKTIVLGALALLVSATAVHSQSARQLTSRIRQNPQPAAPAPPPAVAPAAPAPLVPKAPLVSPLVVALDTNRNGLIEAAEINAVGEVFKKLDKNADGRLTKEEYLGNGESANSPLIKTLDTNCDGVIDAKELSKAASSLRMLDKNADNRLNPSEFRPVAAPTVAKSP